VTLIKSIPLYHGVPYIFLKYISRYFYFVLLTIRDRQMSTSFRNETILQSAVQTKF